MAKGNGRSKPTVSEQALRAAQMIERRNQGWTWPEVAKEAGLSVSAAKRAVRARRESMTTLLEQEPMEIIDHLVEGHQGAIADLERMAADYAEDHPSAAVGAKNSAERSREKLAELLQATGKLPRELGTLRYLVEIRQTVAMINVSVDEFIEQVLGIADELKVPKTKKAELTRRVQAAADELDEKLAIPGTAREK